MYTTCGNTTKRGGLAFDIRRSTQLQPWMHRATCSLASVNQDVMVSQSDCGQHPNLCSCMQRHLRLMCSTTTTVAPTAATTTTTATSAATPTHQELNCPCHAHRPASNCRDNIFCRRRAKERRPPFLPTSNECESAHNFLCVCIRRCLLYSQWRALVTAVKCVCEARCCRAAQEIRGLDKMRARRKRISRFIAFFHTRFACFFYI
jgi:hypothetical protein